MVALVAYNILGLKELWKETLGDPSICIAILDGPVDVSHPSLAAANFTQFETLVSIPVNRKSALVHGTHIASVIFGQHDGAIKGIAPRCRGLSMPIFNDGIDDSIAPCSQLDLARAIIQAVQEGAHIINISGGELSPSGTAHPILADAVQKCADNNVLIVAAAGNDGCDCLHIPGALPSVLAVGAMNVEGHPMDFSNWGERYQTQGILAPGENIPGASPGSCITTNSGTSYATPVVSGIAALLLSLQRKHKKQPNPHAIREAILSSTLEGDGQTALISNYRRLLAGRLNIQGAITQTIKGETSMSDSIETEETTVSQVVGDVDSTVHLTQQIFPANVRAEASDNKMPKTISTSSTLNFRESQRQENPLNQETVNTGSISASACCDTCAGSSAPSVPSKLVFALGQLGFDYGTEARRDSIMQHMDEQSNPNDPNQLLTYLAKNPWDATSILWTLNVDATAIYAVQAQGAFARETCQRFCEFLGEQTCGEVERVSIPGHIAGTAQLSTGQVVPVILPDLRGMYSWNNKALVEAVCGIPPSEKVPQKEQDEYAKKIQAVTNFLQRVYGELRNLGVAPQERAINYAAANAFQVAAVFQDAIQSEMDLDTIEVERSPICRPESDCWDVKMTFFNPCKVYEQARKVYLFSIDLSDVVPVMVSPVRSWFVR